MNAKNLTLPQFGVRVQGRVQCKVVDAATKKVIREYPWQKNLILNQGLDYYMTAGSHNGFGTGFENAVAGTGIAPTTIDSGAITVSQAGNVVTTSAPFFLGAPNDVGRSIKWDTGEEAFITAAISTTQATVSTTVVTPIPDAPFTYYETNQTKMGGGTGGGNSVTEVKRTRDWVTGPNDCGTTWLSPHVAEMKRTYDFSAEVGNITYYEVGFSFFTSPTYDDQPNLFSRVVLDTPVALTAGQVLRLVYVVTATYSPSASFVATVPITGWPVAPALTAQATCGFDFLNIADVGSTGTTNTADHIEPGGPERLVLFSVAYLPPATPRHTVIYRQTNQIAVHTTPVYSTYVANSFTRDISWTFLPSDGNSTSIRTIILGYSDYGTGNFGGLYIICFDENQTKDSLHRLVLNYRWNVGRVLA